MRVLIADDENSARISLVSMIQEMAHPFEICGEAENEEQLIQLLQATNPDIVLLDYQMPAHNGLEMMKVGKEVSPLTKWIILSGLSDYDSAHELVNFGASDYLLKPPSTQELEGALLRAGSSAEKQEEQLHSQLEHTTNLIEGLDELPPNEVQSHVHQTEFCGIQIFVDSYFDETTKRIIRRELMDELQHQLRILHSEKLYPALVEISEDETALISAWHPDPSNRSGKVIMSKLVEIVEKKLLSFDREEAAITLILTDLCLTLEKLQEQFAVVSHFADMRVTRGVRRHWTLSQLDPSESEWLLSLGQMLVDLSSIYQHKNYMAFMNQVDQLQSFLIHHGLNEIPNDTMLAITQFISCSMHCQVDPASNQWLEQLYKHGETLLPHHGLRESGERMVEHVIQELEQHYSRSDLSLSEFAKQLRTTSHYLNARFNQVTGLTFVKYLAKLRVAKAKGIFADPGSYGIMLKKIAEQVGFTSASYFSRCFSEFEGCSPTEYRKNLRNIEEKN